MSSRHALFAFALVSFSAAAFFACSAADTRGSGGFGGAGGSPLASSSTGVTTSGSGTGGNVSSFVGSGGAFTGPYVDFPKAPILDGTAPANAATLFGTGGGATSGGPCLFEPEIDSLFPNNWLRPRFRFNPGTSENLFEIRLHADNEVDDLVVYTTNTSWTMPADMWTSLALHIQDAPITMTVSGGVFDGTNLTSIAIGSSGPFTIAPAQADGAIVYWSIVPAQKVSTLKGFHVGEESVLQTLTPSQVKMKTVGGKATTCIGCHTSTPDGKYVGFTAQKPWGNAIASVETQTIGQEPTFLGKGAVGTLDQFGQLGIQTYSKAHWANGDHIMITPFDQGTAAELAWVDLEAQTNAKGTSYDYLERTGDTHGVGAPTWSHDGKTIVYVSADCETTGRLGSCDADLYSVPYANRKGGTATPVTGASDSSYEEYYPAFSSDDSLLAYNRVLNGNTMYNQPLAEIFVVPSSGGTATRLKANDPPACTAKASPGITNSWPKWSPDTTTAGNKTYYWVIFSSTRAPLGNPQLYVTGVVVEATKVTTYGALYLWNQPETEDNHTPAWDVFKIPVQPPG